MNPAPPDVWGSVRLSELFGQLLVDSDPALRLYVYRLSNGRKLTPAILKGAPFPDLLKYLQAKYGTADYHIIIRRGRTMALSGTISILAPLNWRASR